MTTLIVACIVCIFVGCVIMARRSKTTVIKQKCTGDNITQIGVKWDE